MQQVVEQPSIAAAPRGPAPRPARPWVLALAIALVFLAAASLVAVLHDSMEEWDGAMMILAGRELWQTGRYDGFAAHFWPPLFAAVTGFFDATAGLGFAAGRALSVLAGFGLLLVAYPLGLELTRDRRVALWSAAFLAANGAILVQAASADNNMLDTFLVALAMLLLLRALRRPDVRRFAVVGLVIGVAGLARYTSYAWGPVAVLSALILLPWRTGLRAAAAVTAAFVVVSSPWWIANWAWHGSPLQTWQYMNIGYGLLGWDPKWFWLDQAGYSSLTEIVIEWPRAYARNYVRNLLSFAPTLVAIAGVLLPFAVAGLLRAPLDLDRVARTVLLGGLALFAVLASNAFFVPQHLLSWTLPVTVLAVGYAFRLGDAYRDRFPLLRRLTVHHLLAVLLAFSAWSAFDEARGFLAGDDDDNGKLTDIRPIAEALRRHDPEIASKYVMAPAPAAAYYIGSRYMMWPLYYEGTAEDIVDYRGLPDRVLEYAPKWPARYTRETLRADYLIFNEGASQRLPQFEFLMDPGSPEVPAHFRAVYVAPRVVVYEIDRP